MPCAFNRRISGLAVRELRDCGRTPSEKSRGCLLTTDQGTKGLKGAYKECEFPVDPECTMTPAAVGESRGARGTSLPFWGRPVELTQRSPGWNRHESDVAMRGQKNQKDFFCRKCCAADDVVRRVVPIK